MSHTEWGGDWDSKNAYDLINYTISKGYNIDSWEFGRTADRAICYVHSFLFFFNFIGTYSCACCHIGNELSGPGIGASVGAAQYGNDLIKLKQILDTLYKNTQFKPSLIAPGGFYDKEWFDKLLQVSGPGVVHALSHHIYNLGPGLRATYTVLSTIVNSLRIFNILTYLDNGGKRKQFLLLVGKMLLFVLCN